MIAIGTEVGARRWPYHHAHPGCWGAPWKGTLLAKTDPRAWANTMAFPTPTPNPTAVRRHVRDHAGFLTSVPVLWDFGTDGFKVYWEPPAALRTYLQDVAVWERERAGALAEAAAREVSWELRQAEARRASAA